MSDDSAVDRADRADEAVAFAELIADDAEVSILSLALLADVNAMFADCTRPCRVDILCEKVDETLVRELERPATDAAATLDADMRAELHSGIRLAIC